MYHKTVSGGGQLPPSLLIPLLRTFDLGMKETKEVKTRWDQMAPGTRVIARVGGHGRPGKVIQIVSGGTLGVEVEGIDRIMELNPADVRIDRSVHDDINHKSMVDDRGQPDARLGLLETDWSNDEAGTPVPVKGEDGIPVGPTPKVPGVPHRGEW